MMRFWHCVRSSAGRTDDTITHSYLKILFGLFFQPKSWNELGFFGYFFQYLSSVCVTQLMGQT